MHRPQPRKSALSNLNPIQPTQTTNPTTAGKPVTARSIQRVSVQIDTDTLNYARGAYTQDLARGNATTWSAWVEDALKEATKRSAQRNGTTPVPIPTGTIPRGVLQGSTRKPN